VKTYDSDRISLLMDLNFVFGFSLALGEKKRKEKTHKLKED
jgi:hypothetical protein